MPSPNRSPTARILLLIDSPRGSWFSSDDSGHDIIRSPQKEHSVCSRTLQISYDSIPGGSFLQEITFWSSKPSDSPQPIHYCPFTQTADYTVINCNNTSKLIPSKPYGIKASSETSRSPFEFCRHVCRHHCQMGRRHAQQEPSAACSGAAAAGSPCGRNATCVDS